MSAMPHEHKKGHLLLKLIAVTDGPRWIRIIGHYLEGSF